MFLGLRPLFLKWTRFTFCLFLLSTGHLAQASCGAAFERLLFHISSLEIVERYEAELGNIGQRLTERALQAKVALGSIKDIDFPEALDLLQWTLQKFKEKEKRFWFRYADSTYDVIANSQVRQIENGLAAFESKLKQTLEREKVSYLEATKLFLEFIQLSEIFYQAELPKDQSNAKIAVLNWAEFMRTGVLRTYLPRWDKIKDLFSMELIEKSLRQGMVFLPAREHFSIKAFYEWGAGVFGYGLFADGSLNLHHKARGPLSSLEHDIAHFLVTRLGLHHHPLEAAWIKNLEEGVYLFNVRYRALRDDLEFLLERKGAGERERKLLVILWFHVFHEYVLMNQVSDVTEKAFFVAINRIGNEFGKKDNTIENFESYYAEMGLEKPTPEQVLEDLRVIMRFR